MRFLLLLGIIGSAIGCVISSEEDRAMDCGESYLQRNPETWNRTFDGAITSKILDCLHSQDLGAYCDAIYRIANDSVRAGDRDNAATLYARAARECEDGGWPVYRLAKLAVHSAEFCDEAVAAASEFGTASDPQSRYLGTLGSAISRSVCLGEGVSPEGLSEMVEYRMRLAFGGVLEELRGYVEELLLYNLSMGTRKRDIAVQHLHAAVTELCECRAVERVMAEAFAMEVELPIAMGARLNTMGLLLELRSERMLSDLGESEKKCLSQLLHAAKETALQDAELSETDRSLLEEMETALQQP